MLRLKALILRRFFLLLQDYRNFIYFLAFVCFKNFEVHQMDVKSSLLKGELEEFYIEKPEIFHLLENPKEVCWLKNTLYGLTQTPKEWYCRLYKYRKQQGFKRGTTNSNIYI